MQEKAGRGLACAVPEMVRDKGWNRLGCNDGLVASQTGIGRMNRTSFLSNSLDVPMQAMCKVFVFVFVLAPICARAQDPGNARAGRVIAQSQCTQCHALGPGASPHLEAPSFFVLANTLGMTGRALAVALQTSHETMPNFVLERKDRDNIIAFIMSLRQERQ